MRISKEGVPITILIQSPAFPPNGKIPEKYTCDGVDMSPPLHWGGVNIRTFMVARPTISLALIMEDRDAPGEPFVHWMLFNLSKHMNTLPEGIPKIPVLTTYPWLGYMGTQGRNDYGRPGYGGPCPPRGGRHRYRFTVYALDRVLDLGPGASKVEFREALEGHVIEKGELSGVYRR